MGAGAQSPARRKRGARFAPPGATLIRAAPLGDGGERPAARFARHAVAVTAHCDADSNGLHSRSASVRHRAPRAGLAPRFTLHLLLARPAPDANCAAPNARSHDNATKHNRTGCRAAARGSDDTGNEDGWAGWATIGLAAWRRRHRHAGVRRPA